MMDGLWRCAAARTNAIGTTLGLDAGRDVASSLECLPVSALVGINAEHVLHFHVYVVIEKNISATFLPRNEASEKQFNSPKPSSSPASSHDFPFPLITTHQLLSSSTITMCTLKAHQMFVNFFIGHLSIGHIYTRLDPVSLLPLERLGGIKISVGEPASCNNEETNTTTTIHPKHPKSNPPDPPSAVVVSSVRYLTSWVCVLCVLCVVQPHPNPNEEKRRKKSKNQNRACCCPHTCFPSRHMYRF
ncbi:uncharacterized protein IWZ02DRAFT_198839 [Phyllosticta citriasiana]|uniref:uncharacterized protein n=1 Tax=Phyllosticta citriasiana TaxID=595635 RepID=UPI0030FDA9AE